MKRTTHDRTADSLLVAVLSGPGREVVAAFPDARIALTDADLTHRTRAGLARWDVSARWTVEDGDTVAIVTFAREGWTLIEYRGDRVAREWTGDDIAQALALAAPVDLAERGRAARWDKAAAEFMALVSA